MSSTANNSQSSVLPISPPITSSAMSGPSSSEKTKEKEKAKKKLAIFLDVNLDSFKRFKGLSSFIANSDENEIDKVFKENSYQVYQTMLSTFSSYELGTYKGKHSYAEKEVIKLMELLKRILIHLEGFVKKGWQVKSIVNVLEKMLGIENVQALRMSGFSVLMIFLEVMEKPDKYKLELFASAIDFTPFTADYTNKIIFSRKVFSAATELKRFIVIQSTDLPTKEDSTKLFEQIFNHTDKKIQQYNNSNNNNNNGNSNISSNNSVIHGVNNSTINFHFWFELIKAHYLPVLYPTICKQNGILSAEDTTGFISHCPHELQVVVINSLCNWISTHKQIRDYFFNGGGSGSSNGDSSLSIGSNNGSSNGGSSIGFNNLNNNNSGINITPGKGNISILLEIFKQSCRLPLKYYEIIKKSIQTFRYLFLENTKELESFFQSEELPIYQTFILNEMLHVFEAESQNFEREREAIGTYIIDCIYKYLIEHFDKMTIELKEISMLAMLQGTVTLLRKSNPNKTVSTSLEQNIVSTTLLGWIKSKEINNRKLWDQFHSQFEELYHRPEVIRQIKSKLLQVTTVLKELIYPLSQRLITKRVKDIRNTAKGGEPRSLDHQDIPSDIIADTAIHGLSWDVETCKAIWHCLLDLFKNLQKIKEPTIHELATQIIVDIVDLFIRAEQDVEFYDYLDKSTPEHLSLFNIFGSRLFDTCTLDSKYTKGKVLALSCLCRLVCRHHPQYPINILSHFYSVINSAMVSPSSNGIDLSWSIILNSSNIFNLSIPGANILIPTYLYKIKVILTLKGEITIPLEVRKKCIVIINSLIFYPNQFPNMDIYNQREVKGKLLGNDLTMSEMKKDIVEILSVTLKSDKSSENKVICVWGLSVFLMEEFNCTNYNQDLINDIIDEITVHTLNIDTSVARSALDALSTIGLIFNKLNKPTIQKILVSLCTSILKVLPEIEASTSSISETTIAGHFHCLLDWISLDNSSIFEDGSFAEFRGLMFRCIEEGLGLKGEMWSSNSFSNVLKAQADAAAAALSSSLDSKDLKGVSKNLTIKKNVISKINDTFRDKVGGGNSNSSSTSTGGDDEETPNKFTIIHDACETLLNHCLNFTHNFPSKQGAEFISSMIDEEDDLSEQQLNEPPILTNISTLPLFCVLNENALISVVEIPKPNNVGGTYARLFIRDATGKYVWNFDCDYDLESQIKQSPLPSLIGAAGNESKLLVLDSNQNSYQLINKYSNDPINKPVETDDVLNQLLSNLSKEHPECLPANGKFLNQPLNLLKPNLVEIFNRNQNELDQFIKRENSLNIQDGYALPPSGNSWSAQIPDKAKPIVSQSCRLLLSYLGFLDVNIYTNTIRQLESTNKLSRALAQLDITPGREILKIGVIYTSEGQDDQKIILRNDQAKPNSVSDSYRQFVDGLGWPVELSTHQGYMGGLDRKKTTGTFAPYYATPSVEAIFHDITLMPTNPTDSQQIHKKRHVGNDIVNIVWSEHIRDYNSTTITCQFNDALVIIYPLPNGLFRIQIYRKESKVPMFGPLIHGMAVNKELLPILVRQTAINAYRYVRHNTPNYSKPYVLRKFRIKEIVDRYASDRNYVDYIHSVASGSSNFPIPIPLPPISNTSTTNTSASITPPTTPPTTSVPNTIDRNNTTSTI